MKRGDLLFYYPRPVSVGLLFRLSGLKRSLCLQKHGPVQAIKEVGSPRKTGAKVKRCATEGRVAPRMVRIASRPSTPSQDPRTLALKKPPMLDISRVRHRPLPILRVRNHPPRARFPRATACHPSLSQHTTRPQDNPSSGACSAFCTGTG